MLIIDLDRYGDERGFFMEIYERRRYGRHGLDLEFVQDNRSLSCRNVLRGMHYQINHPQGHLVHVSRGEVFDVGLDLRRGSPTFGQWCGNILNADEPRQVFLPPGVAHGFCVLSDKAEILYKCTEYYYEGDEGGVLWNDPDVGITWPIERPMIKDRDAAFPALKDIADYMLPKI
jgi:dTDP-4-dehydrorhamnose 3,5-epimerase